MTAEYRALLVSRSEKRLRELIEIQAPEGIIQSEIEQFLRLISVNGKVAEA